MGINAMGQANAGTSSAGSSWISTIVARMPYTYKVLQNAIDANPKYDIFNTLASRKDQRLQRQSVFAQQDEYAGTIMIDKRYHQIMYADVDTDKVRRIQEYRKMAAYAELADAIDEIADEAIVKNEHDEIARMKLRGEHDKIVQDEIAKEWNKFVTIFNLEEKGWEYMRRFLVDGELYFENIISQNRPDYGILGVTSIPTEIINPIYDNVQNAIIQGFLLRKPVINPKKTILNQQKEELIVLDKNQITYIHSGLWNEDRTIRLPYIENSRRAYKQLSLIEDSIVIYRLVRAPERLVFKVDVGNMPVPKAEEYVRKLMQQYWARKNFDGSQGRVTNIYDPQSMLDAYWFTKRGDSPGTEVSQLQGGANLGQLEDLMYFVKKLYKTLKVPLSRLDPQDPFKDGNEITREELRFARFIIRIQNQIAVGLKNSFITHLKLRGKKADDKDSKSLWESFDLREHQINIEFNLPTNFAVMREQQIFDLKKNNYLGVIGSELISQSFAQKYYLGLTEEQMAENREWIRKDAAMSWEMQQIVANGPDFRKKLKAEAEIEATVAAGGTPGGGGGTALPGAGGGGGFQPELPPEFGPGPQAPEGGTQGGTPAAGAPAASQAPK
jgi:hypothetical protein